MLFFQRISSLQTASRNCDLAIVVLQSFSHPQRSSGLDDGLIDDDVCCERCREDRFGRWHQFLDGYGSEGGTRPCVTQTKVDGGMRETS